MAPIVHFQNEHGNQPSVASATLRLAWINQASRRHCHFGLKPTPAAAPQGPLQVCDFRPGKEEVI